MSYLEQLREEIERVAKLSAPQLMHEQDVERDFGNHVVRDAVDIEIYRRLKEYDKLTTPNKQEEV